MSGTFRMRMAGLANRVIRVGMRMGRVGATAGAAHGLGAREEPEGQDQHRRDESSSHQGLSLAEANTHVIDPPRQTLETC